MDQIARATEPDLPYGEWLFTRTDQATQDVADSVAQSAVGAVYRLGLAALVVPTTSGRTARLVSAHRPNVPVLAISPRARDGAPAQPALRRDRGPHEHETEVRGLLDDCAALAAPRRRPLRRSDRDHRRPAGAGAGDQPVRGPPRALRRAAGRVRRRMTDFDAIAQGMTQAVPFAGYLGLEITSVAAGEAVVVLPERAELTNHVGSQHAGALFTVAEAASGAAFVGAFVERMGEVTPLARSAEISYEKIAKGADRGEGQAGRCRPRRRSRPSTRRARSCSPARSSSSTARAPRLRRRPCSGTCG